MIVKDWAKELADAIVDRQMRTSQPLSVGAIMHLIDLYCPFERDVAYVKVTTAEVVEPCQKLKV